MHPDAISRISDSLVALVRRANDPRGNQRINAAAGIDVDRASSVMLARIDELEPVRLSDLAEAAGVDISTASRQVSRLVDEGLVVRAADPGDRRAARHRLTEAGRDLHARLVAARRSVLEDRLAAFSDEERARFADLLERFVAGLADVPPDYPRSPGAQEASSSSSSPPPAR